MNVPGLGDVTPQQIQEIKDAIRLIQDEIDILSETQVRQGVVSGIGINDTSHAVVFTTAMPSDNFTVALTPRIAASSGSASYPTLLIQSGSKSVTGFTFFCENNGNPAIISEVEWVAIHSA